MTSSPELASLEIADFAPHRDTVFELQTSDGVVPLKLVKVDPAGNSGRAGGAFSLLFAAPKGPWLPQAVYLLRHPSLGNLEIFLVPVGPQPEGNGYHAVFA
jgi:predicted transcriptional regulator